MITQVDLKEIPGRRCNFNNAVSQEVLQFHKSDWSACEVNTNKYKTVHSACAAYKKAIQTLNVGVMAVERSGRLFLIRK